MLTLGNVQENLTLRSLNRIGVHEAVLVLLICVKELLLQEGLCRRLLKQKDILS